MIDITILKNAERVLRIFLVALLIMSGLYKFMIGFEHFVTWYEPKFSRNAFGIPVLLTNAYLYAHPVIELILAAGLIFNRTRTIALYAYFTFITVLMFGHFSIEEFHEVNGLFDYMFAGLLIYILPQHQSLIKNDK